MSAKKPKVLLLDIETSPLVVYSWGIWDQTITPEQVIEDWTVLSWAAKWLDDPINKTIYMDNRNSRNVRDDKRIVTEMHKLLNEADIIVTQNGKKFDEKKLNSRFIIHDLTPPSPFKHFDTRQVAKKKFGFTSNSLKDLCEYLDVEYKKSEHKKFPGLILWKECLGKNLEAWKEMEEYNKLDVWALEGIYKKMEPWDNSINHNLYTDLKDVACNCGSKKLQRRGVTRTTAGVYQRYQCQDCGAWTRGRSNLLTPEQKKNLRRKA